MFRLWQCPFALCMLTVVLAFLGYFLLSGQVLLPLDYLGWDDPYRFYPPWSEQGPFLRNQGLQDSIQVYYPALCFLHSQLQSGIIPLWAPLEGFGLPTAALHGSGYLFPVHWLTYGLLEPINAWRFEQALQILVGSLSTYALLVRFTGSLQGAAIGATAWTFGGWNAAYFQMPTYSWTLALLPMALWGIERHREPDQHRGALLQIGCGVGAILMVGHLQVSLPAVAMIALWGISRGGPQKWRVLLAIFAGIGLALPHLVPLAELLSLSGRPRSTSENVVSVLLLPREYLCMIFPSLLGLPTDNFYFGAYLTHPVVNGREHCVYAGILTLCLALVAAYRSPNRYCRPMALLVLAPLILAGAPPLYLVLVKLCPPLLFLTPTRFLPFVIFLICVLSAHGWAALQETPLSRREGQALSAVLAVFVLGALSLVVPAMLLTEGFQTWLLGMVKVNFATKPPHFEGDFGPVFIAMVRARLSLLSPPLLLSMTALLATMSLLLRSVGKKPTFQPLMMILAVELSVYFFTMNAPMPVAANFPTLPSIEYLSQGTRMADRPGIPPPYRILGAGQSLFPNYPLVYGIASLEAYESVFPDNYRGLFKNLNEFGIFPYQQAAYYDTNPLPRGFLDLTGVSTLHNHKESWNPRLEEPDYRGDLLELKRTSALRAFLLDRWQIQSEVESRASVVAASFEPRSGVLLESPPTFPSAATEHFRSIVPTYYSAHRVEFDIDTEQPTLLVLNDLHYPGWQASVNGKSAIMLQAYSFARAVELGAGSNKVVMTFRPTGYRVTLTLALISLGLLILLSFRGRSRDRTSD